MSISSLPKEIQEEIFLTLPAKSILACKYVCKVWFNQISDRKFINNHLNLVNQSKNISSRFMFFNLDYGFNLHYGNWRVSSIDCALISSSPHNGAVSVDYPFNMNQRHTIDILGSCNGLICVGICAGKSEHDKRNNICIWNPTTGEYKRIPIPLNDFCLKDQYDNSRISHRAKYGFGYDRNLEDYKLVRVAYKHTCGSTIQVYSLGSDSWRNIQTIPYMFDFASLKCSGLLFKGALHWLGHGQETFSEVIVSFDISGAKAMVVPLPEMHLPEDTVLLKTVGVLGDCLCLTCVSPGFRIDIWVLQNYGARDSWTKHSTITPNGRERGHFRWNRWKLIWVFQNGEILMDMQHGCGLVLCHPEKGIVRKLLAPDISDRMSSAAKIWSFAVKTWSSNYVDIKPIKRNTRRDFFEAIGQINPNLYKLE